LGLASIASVSVNGRRQCNQVVVILTASGCDGLHAYGAPSSRDVLPQQRTRNRRLADTGVGPGDENTLGHRFARGSTRMIALPSSVILGSGFHAWP
jgi:hypothetical protein